jgi:hypothetical protein
VGQVEGRLNRIRAPLQACHEPMWVEEKGTSADPADMTIVCGCGKDVRSPQSPHRIGFWGIEYGVTLDVEQIGSVYETVMGFTATAKGLFDHLVGAGEQSGRHIEVERSGGLHIDDKLEPGRW